MTVLFCRPSLPKDIVSVTQLEARTRTWLCQHSIAAMDMAVTVPMPHTTVHIRMQGLPSMRAAVLSRLRSATNSFVSGQHKSCWLPAKAPAMQPAKTRWQHSSVGFRAHGGKCTCAGSWVWLGSSSRGCLADACSHMTVVSAGTHYVRHHGQTTHCMQYEGPITNSFL